MALTEQVIMPGVDYQAICDAVRTRAGGTDLLKSGDIASVIASIPEGAQATNGTFTLTNKTANLDGYTLPCTFVPTLLVITMQLYTNTFTYINDGSTMVRNDYGVIGGIQTIIYYKKPVCILYSARNGYKVFSNFSNFNMSISSGKLLINTTDKFDTNPYSSTAINTTPFFGAAASETSEYTESRKTVYRWAAIG